MPIANDGTDDTVGSRDTSTNTGPSTAPEDAQSPRGAHTGKAATQNTMGSSVGWTILGAILPGIGLWPTRRRRLGVGVFLVFLAAVAVAAWEATHHLGFVAGIAVRPTWLIALSVVAALVGVGLVFLVAATHLLTRPHPATGAQRAGGAVLVGLLSFVVAAPLAIVTNITTAQADLVSNLFQHGTNMRSQTRPTLQDNTFASKPRLNILLLGGDSSAVRDKIDPTEGIRTDTTMLASIDTATGNTTLIQLPRNMEAFPFPAGSPFAKAYPHGFWDGKDNENPEYELNAVWENVPHDHPELVKDTDYPNADALKSAVEGITGLKPDYFVLLNIDGIQKLIDAMGGLTINVNYRVPMNQTTEEAQAGIPPKSGYLEKGPNRHLSGYEAMWYARSRSQSKDPDRMARQGCVVRAIVQQAHPQTLLGHYDSIAAASKSALLTDIPQEMAPALMDLGVKMKDARIKRVLFGYPTTKYADGTAFEPWKPDVTKMQALIQKGIAASMAAPSSSAPSAAGPTARATSAKPSPTATSKAPSPSASATPSIDPNADLSDACAWHG